MIARNQSRPRPEPVDCGDGGVVALVCVVLLMFGVLFVVEGTVAHWLVRLALELGALLVAILVIAWIVVRGGRR